MKIDSNEFSPIQLNSVSYTSVTRYNHSAIANKIQVNLYFKNFSYKN